MAACVMLRLMETDKPEDYALMLNLDILTRLYEGFDLTLRTEELYSLLYILQNLLIDGNK